MLVEVRVMLEKDLLRYAVERSTCGVTPQMLKKVHDPVTLKILLSLRPICEITSEILEAHITLAMLELFLDRFPSVRATNKVIMNFLRAPDCCQNPSHRLEFLRRLWNEDSVVTELLQLARSSGYDEFHFLLSQRQRRFAR